MKLSSVLTVAVATLLSFSAGAQVKKTAAKKTVTTKTAAKKTAAKKPVLAAAAAKDTSVRIKIVTDSGTMIVKLYDSTPLHRDNFVKLVKQGFYDSLMFHRVIPGFMIQGGDPLSKNAPAGTMLGNGGDDMERIPAEFRSTLIHKRGVLAAARDDNPAKASSACQFYLVEGKPVTDQELSMMEARTAKKYSAAERDIYKKQGGTPFLDQGYTVFGEVESGMEVIDKIANVPRDQANRPLGDVRMYMEVVK
jgi:peptidyl-prolyl cis-trans isomerase B (cyclophilin B)